MIISRIVIGQAKWWFSGRQPNLHMLAGMRLSELKPKKEGNACFMIYPILTKSKAFSRCRIIKDQQVRGFFR